MPAHALLPPVSELVRLRDRGLTQQEIADKVYELTGNYVARSTVAAALVRAGKSQPKTRWAEELPWRVAREHLMETPARFLRDLGRQRAGLPLPEDRTRRLNNWLDTLDAEGAVVGYSPSRGFLYVPRRKVDGRDGIPIRRPLIRDEEIAE